VWAVGDSGPFNTNSTLILHWDGTQWATVPSPSPSANENYLYSISAVSATDIWAVGSRRDSGSYAPLTLHWDGTQWNVVGAPGSAELQGVSARSSNDVWAVGSGGSAQSTIMHWDGSAWTIVSHPVPGPNQISELYGVLAVSSNEVWAVGDVGHYYLQARIERYVGSCETPTTTPSAVPTHTATPLPSATGTPSGCVPGWVVVPSPSSGYSEDTLHGVAALSANDIWTVGSSYDGSAYWTLIEHWDGTVWSIVPSPSPGSPGIDFLWGVARLSGNDAWAAGSYSNGSGSLTLVEHWNGTAWTVVPSPNAGSGINELLGIAAQSANDVWAVGHAGSQTLVEHWDGSVWSIVPSPSPGSSTNFLFGVAATGLNNVWAVGWYDNGTGAGRQTLTMHWNGTAWTVVTSPSPWALRK
jgi:hypothetical protein